MIVVRAIEPYKGSDSDVEAVSHHSSAYEMAGDGYADLLTQGETSSQTIVVFGEQDFFVSDIIDMASLNGTDGFQFMLIDEDAFQDVEAVAGDGYDDFSLDAAEQQNYVTFDNDDFSAELDMDLKLVDSMDSFYIALPVEEEDFISVDDMASSLKSDDGLAGSLILDDSGNIEFSNFSPLYTIPAEKLNIETNTLAAMGNTLTINSVDLLDMFDDPQELFIDGDSHDKVISSDIWNSEGSTAIGGVSYNIYTLGNTTLYIDAGVEQSGMLIS